MFHASPRQLAEICGARLIAGPAGRDVCGAAVDSRNVAQDGLFVALRGERVDGNDYVAQALQRGAGAVLMTREPGGADLEAADAAGAALLVCNDGEAALQALASWWRGRLDCVVVGVTGSSGKTTTKEMCAAVLASRYRTHATAGNYNSTLGAPLTVLACPLDAEALVVEMGMNGPGEIAAIAAVARPHFGIVTNVGTAHIGILGSRQNIAAAKAELLEALPAADESGSRGGCALLWGEDDFAGWMSSQVACARGVRVLTYGTGEGDDCRCPVFSIDELGCAHGTATLPSGASLQLDLCLPGAHNVADALAAAAVGDLLGVGPEDIARALKGVALKGNRQEVRRLGGGITLVNDCYNANADSMRRAVDVLCTLGADRRVACLGDMGELGESSEAIHTAVGGYVAGRAVDVLVAVGPLSESMARAARLMGMSENDVLTVPDARAAADVLNQILRPGDALLVKASRSTGLEKTVEMVMKTWE